MKKADTIAREKQREIVKEQNKGGSMIYRYSDFETDGGVTDDLGFCFTLIIGKFKSFLDLLGDDEGNVAYGHVLGAIIKDTERELEDISQFIEKTIGDVNIIYDEDRRWNNFYDKTVAGLVLRPTDMKIEEA